ncbi:MAG: hypothetical protein AAF623_20330 [Planctomycetota bacterium]
MSTDFKYRSKALLNVETRASNYDRLSGALVACIILFGFLFTVLFLVWLTSVFDFSRRAAGPIIVVNESGDTKPKGEADDFIEPGVEEMPEVETPQLAQALEAVTDAVSAVKASNAKRSGTAAQQGRGGGYGSREGGPGTGGDGIPESKRWKINYEAEDFNSYTKMLAFFNIDVGVVSLASNDIWRIREMDKGGTATQTDRASENRTLRFTHQKMRMKRWDVEIAKRAGVDMTNAAACQFYPESTRAVLRQAEAQFLASKGRELIEVRNTIFDLESDGSGGFQFTVTDVLYR